MFRNFFVKAANKNFSTLNSDYEITGNNDTQVVPCSDSDAPEIPLVSYDFVDIASIEGVEKDRIIGN
jgi:replication factor A1